MSNKIVRPLSFALFSLVLALGASSSAFGAATIVILNADGAGEGFNDPTPAAPVGGNPGTTLGAQRLNAFQAAANIWGATLTSSVTITIRAQFNALTCTPTSAVLGSAGAAFIERNFAGAPFTGTWYGEALAEKLSGSVLDPTHEINATFNSDLGQAGCLTGTFFYLGVDNNHGANIDLVTVLLHEFGHGLGFQTFTSSSTGAQNGGFPTIYDRFLVDGTSGKSWLQMSNAERQASAINTSNLFWNGPEVMTDAATVLTSGKDSLGRPSMYAPNPVQGGSSVSHWDTTATPNQLMEPFINADLTHNVTTPSDLTFSEMSDIGWVTTPLPNTISPASGDNQGTLRNQPFPILFSVTTSPAVAGLTVTWTANPSAAGASGTFPSTGTGIATSTTNALGTATAPPFNANGTTGHYSMNATVPGAGTATFALTNMFSPTAEPATISGGVTTAAGSPLAGVIISLQGQSAEITITDSNGHYHFDGVDTGNFYTVTPSLVNYRFSPASRSFSLVGNQTDAVFTGAPEAIVTANAIDSTEYFVRQHYLDFLGREPDQGGFAYWSDQINQCGSDATCIRSKRTGVSAAFFIEAEFQQTGSFIYRLYKSTLGRHLSYREFISDRGQLRSGPDLEANKTALAHAFVQRAEFIRTYQSSTTAASFVDALLRNVEQSTGVDLSAERNSLIGRYETGAGLNQSRGLVVKDIAESAALGRAVYNKAFVLMQYFGYLQRDPDQGGYDFWLDVVTNRDVANYRSMVCAFISSAEYQRRFGSVVSRTDAECSTLR